MFIEQLFPIPVLIHNVPSGIYESIQNEIYNCLPKVRKTDLTNPWGDGVETSFKYGKEENKFIQQYNCNNLENEILNASRYFLGKYNVKNTLDYAIINSWINFSHKGQFQFDHSHTDSIVYPDCTVVLSGVYYFQTNQNDGDIIFSSPNPLQLSSLDIFSMGYANYRPQMGKMLLFPSWLQHRVAVNNTDNIRISISFNVGIKRL